MEKKTPNKLKPKLKTLFHFTKKNTSNKLQSNEMSLTVTVSSIRPH